MSTGVCSIRVFQHSSVYKCMGFGDLSNSLIGPLLPLPETIGVQITDKFTHYALANSCVLMDEVNTCIMHFSCSRFMKFVRVIPVNERLQLCTRDKVGVATGGGMVFIIMYIYNRKWPTCMICSTHVMSCTEGPTSTRLQT